MDLLKATLSFAALYATNNQDSESVGPLAYISLHFSPPATDIRRTSRCAVV